MADPTIEELEAQIAQIEKYILNEPKRIQEERDRKLRTMPPSDEVVSQHHEHLHNLDLTRSEKQNIRITQAKDGLILFLGVIGIVALSLWIYNSLQAV